MSTYGSASAPGQNTINYDAILSTSLFNYQRTLVDNISKANAYFYKIQENGLYEDEDGGVAIQIPLMYALGTADWYSSYDTLNTDPMDGVTSAFFDWRQMSVPISISRLEERKNSTTDRIISLIETKIAQAELGIKEKFSKAILQGSIAGGGSSLVTADTSNINGASGIDPLPLLVNVTANSSTKVGNLDGSVNTWWQNQSTTSSLTSANKSSDLIFELDTIYNNCSKGPGGPPDIAMCDPTTYQLIRTAYYQVYRRQMDSDNNFPFENIRFNRTLIFWDEFVPDAYTGVASTATYGTLYFLNSQFMGIKYDKETNFVSRPFQQPVNQDARVAHILWMGNQYISNRRKQGVYCKIPRSLTWSI